METTFSKFTTHCNTLEDLGVRHLIEKLTNDVSMVLFFKKYQWNEKIFND